MELEIKVMWCKGLSSFNFFQKLTVYAAVSITSENEKLLLTQDQKQEQKTIVDEDNGDGNPEWNHSMKFDLRPLKSFIPNFEDLCLLFELRNHGQLFGDKTIGEVRVPLTELIQSVGGEIVRFVSYEVRSPEGKHNGILDFSYKVIGNNNNYTSNISSIHNITGYNHYHHGHEQEHESQGHGTNSDTHVIEHHHHHHHHHSQLDGNTNSDNGYHHHSQLDGNNTISDTHVIGHHHHSQLDGNATHDINSDTHVMGYQHHHHSQLGGSASEVIQYPKIDLEEHSVPPLVYPPPSSSSSFTADSAHYPPAPALYPPPPPQTWADTPPRMSHYPPPQPYVYPPPPRPPPQQQPYGVPHWGYQRPPDYHHW
ncbi:FK506-binding protein 5-like [Chenopodium quinoa]|uniref:FK506-binding protein 5-like n=1 Tax=Chenopodium quinoa TaxID=63459 RepID=UPI000B77E552|nr:FK506-binding protein 5-like [Chenopodium quinoa]